MEKLLTAQQIRYIQLKVLDAFVDLAKKHSLRYFLYYGSLLGAVRHKGYIPWDDDIDIAMPRHDYELLKKIDSSEFKIKIITPGNCLNCPYPFVKITDLNTLLMEDIDDAGLQRFGVSVDIFPVDVFCKKIKFFPRVHIINILAIIRNVRLIKINGSRGYLKNTLHAAGKFLFAKVSIGAINFWIDRLSFIKASKNDLCGVLAGAYGEDEYYNSKHISSDVLVEFEGRLLPIPIGWNEILGKIYGNYMKMPEEGKRKSHHKFKVVSLTDCSKAQIN